MSGCIIRNEPNLADAFALDVRRFLEAMLAARAGTCFDIPGTHHGIGTFSSCLTIATLASG